MPSDSDRILAEPIPIRLLGGRTAGVRFGTRAIKAVEDKYGSIGAVQDLFKDADQGRVPIYGPTIDLLALGLMEEGISENELLDLADPRLISQYAEAAVRALGLAMPEGGQNLPLAPAGGSNGASFTTSPPSASAAATSNSGE